jgi:hypothetical protein
MIAHILNETNWVLAQHKSCYCLSQLAQYHSYRVFILKTYYMSRPSYRQTPVSPGKLKVIHSVIIWAVSRSVLHHRVWQKLLLCSVLCFYDFCGSMSNQPARWTPVIIPWIYKEVVCFHFIDSFTDNWTSRLCLGDKFIF